MDAQTAQDPTGSLASGPVGAHIAYSACLLVGLIAASCVARGQGYAPDQAVAAMQVAAGFEVQLVASEPLVRQPVCIEFDDRGRLWVIQYLQYPNPAGLTRVEVDRYSRTQYDRVPQPPPHGPAGSDRITILTDTDGDGRMDQGRDFVHGLNLASGLAMGHGGVFVLNAPYLLFYPDRDGDDIPDGDPEVLLSGFGMQDAHSVANSLTWGPDGWLYGCQGSTVTANIRGIEFQQGVWRYDPTTRRFELFCEGGGNSWGLDFDRVGNLFYSTNYGGYVLLHGVQGGYFIKSFAKHGELHNRHAYGYFDHAPHANFQGGHVTVGGIVYNGDSFPKWMRGKYIAADLLGHAVHWHDIRPRGSTFQTAHGGTLLRAGDTWFAPSDVTMGPDGAVYVADWHDARTAHPDPDAHWDRTNGRIYRITAASTATDQTAAAPESETPGRVIDFRSMTTAELLKLHKHERQWFVRRARQELVRRGDRSALASLRQSMVHATNPAEAIEALWSHDALGGLDAELAADLLGSPHPPIRFWTVRLLGDDGGLTQESASRLVALAEREDTVWVRQQLACTAARLPSAQAIPIVHAQILRDLDLDDPYLPLLLWWATERHSIEGRQQVMRRFVQPATWQSSLARDFLLPRLVRRYAAEGSPAGLDCVQELLSAAPSSEIQDSMWEPVLAGLQESENNQTVTLAAEHALSQSVSARRRQRPDNSTLLRLAILLGHRDAVTEALDQAMEATMPIGRRLDALDALSLSDDAGLHLPLLGIVRSDADDRVRTAALQSLAGIDHPAIAPALIEVHQSTASQELQHQIRELLLGRRPSALAWLEAVDRGQIGAAVTPIEQIRRVSLLNDPKLDQLVLKHWGRLEAATAGELLAEVRRLNNDLRAGPGDPVKGHQAFLRHCAACHRLFGDGKKVGPDLTTANRSDRAALLVALVAPSSVIRKEYASVVVETSDGRILTGLPMGETAEDPRQSGVTLVDNRGHSITIPSGEIESVTQSPVSLMPEGLHRLMSPQELRDLFAYLESEGPNP